MIVIIIENDLVLNSSRRRITKIFLGIDWVNLGGFFGGGGLGR